MTTGRTLSILAAVAISAGVPAGAQTENNRVAAETDWAVFEGTDPRNAGR